MPAGIQAGRFPQVLVGWSFGSSTITHDWEIEIQAEGGEYLMPLVKIKEDETFENALRRFKRKCEKSGILSELKKRQHFEKPSAKRKRKMLAARKKTLKRVAQERRTMGV
jgi:small subunit ribosomal protein S21